MFGSVPWTFARTRNYHKSDHRCIVALGSGDGMTKFGIGQGVPRWEDPRLLRGGGRYSDDLNRQGQAYGCVIRSPHAKARIQSIDATAALVTPGVLAVYTGTDMEAAGYGTLPCLITRQRSDGSRRSDETNHKRKGTPCLHHT